MSLSDGTASALAEFLGRGPFKLSELLAVKTLTGNETLTEQSRNIQKLDPGGSARDVTLPAEAPGLFYWVINAADAAENLVIKDAAGNTLATANQNESAVVWCDGTTWHRIAIVAIALS